MEASRVPCSARTWGTSASADRLELLREADSVSLGVERRIQETEGAQKRKFEGGVPSLALKSTPSSPS